MQAETGILTGDHAAVEAELATLLHILPMHRGTQRLVASIAHALLRLHRCGSPADMAKRQDCPHRSATVLKNLW